MTTRGIAFCTSAKCPFGTRLELQAKSHFVMNCTGYTCGGCGERGAVVLESSEWRCPDSHELRFTEVRLNYQYDTYRREYRELAIVKDTAAMPGAVYELWSPITKSKVRALEVAELTLTNLRRNPHLAVKGNILPATEVVLNLDRPRDEFTAALAYAAEGWGER